MLLARKRAAKKGTHRRKEAFSLSGKKSFQRAFSPSKKKRQNATDNKTSSCRKEEFEYFSLRGSLDQACDLLNSLS